MNTDAIVFERLSASGIPGAKLAFQEGHAPPLPFFVYLERRGLEVFANNENFAKIQRYRAELYQRENDPDLRERFEAAVASIGPFKSYEEWVPTEQCLMTTYDFSIDINRDKE